MQARVKPLRFSEPRDLPPRLILADHRKEAHLCTERLAVARHVARAAQAQLFLLLLDEHHRYRRLGRDARDVAVPVAVEHDVADDQDARLHADAKLRTTQKLRVVGPRRHQLLRIDFETPPSTEVLASKLADFREALGDCDVVLLSDYGKGGLAHIETMIREGRKAKKLVLVDPKGDDYERYRGASLVTPNVAELREVVGTWRDERDLAARAERLRTRLRLEAVLLTRGDEGMTLFRPRRTLRVRAEKREVSDVTGAGDTVIATLAVMLAAGESLESAVRIANRAGGIKVTKFGTAVVTPAELFSA